jgi:hypothetical protein
VVHAVSLDCNLRLRCRAHAGWVACGFDLTGKSPETNRCAECGADLGRKNAVIPGHFRRRWGLLATGLVIAFTAGISSTSIVSGQLSDLPWLRWMPLRYVLYRAALSDVETRSSAFSEINDREQAGQFRTKQWNDITDAASACEADPNRLWDYRWNALMHRAAVVRRTDSVHWARYVDNLIKVGSSSDPHRRADAIGELQDRADDGGLTALQQDDANDSMLTALTDRSQPFDPVRARFLIDARRSGHLDDGRWHRCIETLLAVPPTSNRFVPDEVLIALNQTVRRRDQVPWDDVIATALTRQRLSGWADLLDEAARDGTMTDAQWRRYADQATARTLSVQVRPFVRPGEPLPCRLVVGGIAAGSNSDLRVSYSDLAVREHGNDGGGDGDRLVQAGPVGSGVIVIPASALGPDTGIGPRQLDLVCKMLVETSPRAVGPHRSLPKSILLTAAFTVTADAPAVATTVSADQIRQSISVIPMSFLALHRATGQPEMSPRRATQLTVRTPPADVAFKVFVKADGSELPAGSIACGKHGTASLEIDSPPTGAARFDIILRSDTGVAARSLDALDPWIGSIVLADTPRP